MKKLSKKVISLGLGLGVIATTIPLAIMVSSCKANTQVNEFLDYLFNRKIKFGVNSSILFSSEYIKDAYLIGYNDLGCVISYNVWQHRDIYVPDSVEKFVRSESSFFPWSEIRYIKADN